MFVLPKCILDICLIYNYYLSFVYDNFDFFGSSNPNIEITLLGLTYNVQGAEFKDKSDRSVDAAGFFAQLNAGDMVRIKDERPADGIAEKVSYDVEDD